MDRYDKNSKNAERYRVYLTTHTGAVRQNNEDNFTINNTSKKLEYKNADFNGVYEAPLLAAVFDGMGGESKGEYASYISSKVAKSLYFTIKDAPDAPLDALVGEFVQRANNEIRTFLEENHCATGGSTVVVSKTSEVGADADDVKLLLLLQLLLLFLVCLPAYLFYYSVQFGVSQRLGNLATSPSHRRADTAFGNSKHWFVVSYRAVGINSVNTLVVVENKALDGGTVVCFFHISKNFRNLNFSENKGTNNRNTYN